MKRHNILVADANALGSLACIRSLGRAGHRVIATSASPRPLGFGSRYAKVCLSQPPYDPAATFIEWLDHAIEQNAIDCIIPTEGLLLAIRPWVERYQHLMPLSQKGDEIYRAFAKFDFFNSFLAPGADARLRFHLPPTVLISPSQTSLEVLENHAGPYYLKMDASYAKTNGAESLVIRLPNLEKVASVVSEQLQHYSRFIIQSHVKGEGVGVFFLRWKGKVIARFMHHRLHEVPWEGGVSSLRRSWWHEDIYQDALARLSYLDWNGVSMFEYRWDPSTDEFFLMELNARFWGSLHLPLQAGIDFPKLLISAWNNESFAPPEAQIGVRCRLTFPKEVEYVISRMKSPNLSLWEKIWTLLEFFVLSLDPRVKSDMLFPGDNKLYLRSISDTVRKLLS
ncbi:Predicted ATP-dependent carboligase, ATP-grasp superfamily [Nitrosospira multiformis]|uniref:Predicted ATP-dependent carboligase, ATP-grasp superfamily n=1 Tax=Nitrosospira multiformis TaxID=1231 RepID=A0A1H8C0U8_9PROT|nr:hypothetical protein [Nitrosospira multiformis]SEM88686.1 Predicted ATP-dependent carboligase, ATP-grasp superfamily [Nitrosospira multiformis]